MSDNSIMKVKTQTQVALGNARSELKDTLERVKELRIKVANLRLDVADERRLQRIANESARAVRAATREQKRAERIAKMEAKLDAMRLKANSQKQTRRRNQKASVAVVYSPEQIAALNAERGLV
jgi:lipopolysaccharide biosynthesis protein